MNEFGILRALQMQCRKMYIYFFRGILLYVFKALKDNVLWFGRLALCNRNIFCSTVYFPTHESSLCGSIQPSVCFYRLCLLKSGTKDNTQKPLMVNCCKEAFCFLLRFKSLSSALKSHAVRPEIGFIRDDDGER